MKFQKRILIGLGLLATMLILALNLNLVSSFTEHEEGVTTLTLIELAAQAQTETCCETLDWDENRELCDDLSGYFTYCQIGGPGCIPVFCW